MDEEELMVQQMRHQPRLQHMDHHQRLQHMDHHQRIQHMDHHQRSQHIDHHPRSQHMDHHQRIQHMDLHPQMQPMVHQSTSAPSSHDIAFNRNSLQQRYYSQHIPMDHHFSQSQLQMLPISSQSTLNSPVQSPQMAPRRGYGGATRALPMHYAPEYECPLQQHYPSQSTNSGDWFSGMASGAGVGSQPSQQSQQGSQSQPDPLLPPTGPTPGAQGDGSGMGATPLVSMVADGAGDAPVPQPGTSADGLEPQDLVQILARRKLSGMQDLAALRARRMRLEHEVSMALTEQHDAQKRSEKLDEEIMRERNSLARAQERETALEQTLSAKREEAERGRAYIQMQAQFHERQVDSYCAEMTKLIETARAAPDVYEADNLKRVLEELKTEQQETNSELAEIDKELNLLREEYVALMEQGKNFEICSEKDLPDALQLLVADMDKQLEEDEAEEKELEETVKSMEAEKEALTLRIKKLRERPLRTLVPRVSAYMTAASSSMTSSSSTNRASAVSSRGPRMFCTMERLSK